MREANYQIMSGWLLTLRFEIFGKDRHVRLPQFSGWVKIDMRYFLNSQVCRVSSQD